MGRVNVGGNLTRGGGQFLKGAIFRVPQKHIYLTYYNNKVKEVPTTHKDESK